MKILAVNGSPNGPSGNTDILMQAFLSGAKVAGADIDMVYLKDKNINHCKGCFNCMQKTPGVCCQNDDMGYLLDKVQQADVLVYGTPLHTYTVTSYMKIFMDRNMALTFAEPTYKKMVLVSTCGLPQKHVFTGLIETFKLMENPYRERVGMILCPSGSVLSVEQFKSLNQWFLNAREDAGRELVQSGIISSATQEVMEKDLLMP